MNTITRFLLFPAALIITILWYTCNEEPTKPPPPPETASIQLILEDVGVTEVWLKLSLPDSTKARNITFTRDGNKILTKQVFSPDTVFVDDGLQPNRTYTYQAYRMRDTTTTGKSDIVTATTMNISSHDFTFQTYLLGDGAGSVLLDVAIINDTLTYGVGDINKRDSLGNWDPNVYNLVKWNGRNWELKRIPFNGPCSAVDYPPLKSIWAFSASNILVTNGGSIVRYDGTNAVLDCGMNSLLTGAINKIYAVNPQDVYAVGNNGSIVHFANGTWRRVQSGTTADIQDVWGYYEEKTKENVVLCAVSNVFEPGDRKILRIYPNGKVDALQWRTDRRINSIWFNNINHIFTTGGGVFIRQADGQWNEQTSVPLYYTRRVRGSMFNDVFVAGDFGLIAHYNGVSWYHWQNQAAAIWYSCSYRDGLFMAVGQTPDQKGVVTIIRR